jgi:C-terminal processing protease CtpA/Prc
VDKEGQKQTFTTNNNLFINKPIAVLVNGRTASASEAMTSAMMYYETATVIGEKTYGKGTALNSPALIYDDDNTPYAISVVIGKYYVYTENTELDMTDGVADGKWCIDEVGLTPNIEVSDREFRENLAEDTDIQAAIEHWGLE